MSEILPPDPSRRVRPDGVPNDAPPRPEPEVGFAQNSAQTAAMMGRYLVGRAIAARLSVSLMLIGLGLLAAAVALWVWVSPVLAVLVGIVGLFVLLFRAIVMGVLRSLMGIGRLGPAEAKIRGLVGDTSGDLRRELRRIGLPGSVFGLPLLMMRLVGKRRRATVAKLTNFKVGNVVPRARLDELQFIVRNDIQRRP